MDNVRASLDRFIAAFNALDMERFAACLSSNVSLFPPNPIQGTRIDGFIAVVEHFKRVFHAELPAGPAIHPEAIDIRYLDRHAAVATFQFARANGSIGRRSIIFQHEEMSWKIVHIHASNTQPPENHDQPVEGV